MDEQLIPFINRLIAEKGLDYLEDDVLDEMRADIYASLQERINAVIVTKLPAEKLPEFEDKMENATDDELQQFVKEYIPNLDEVIAAELVLFKEIYLNS